MSDAPITLHLLRHGQPVLPGRMLGRTDMPATTAGIASCTAKGALVEFDAIASSDLLRASACATVIATAKGLTLAQDARWRELDFGVWDGLVAADIDPAALGRFWNDPDQDPPLGGERWSALVARVAEAIGNVTSTTLVVTHGGAMRAALSVLCGLDFTQVWAFDLPYAALLSIRIWRGSPSTGPATAQITGLLP